jgi:hypothetical protein
MVESTDLCQSLVMLQSNESELFDDKKADLYSSLPVDSKFAPMKVCRLTNSTLSKSMPCCIKPNVSAEDDGVLSLRTSRYHKLDASSQMDLPSPRKFVPSPKPANRLTRSQSVYDFSACNASSPSARLVEGHDNSIEGSSRSPAYLRASLNLDDFQFLRPPSLDSICEELKSNSVYSKPDIAEF